MGYLFDIFLATKVAGIHCNTIMEIFVASCIKKWDIFSTYFWPQKEQGFASILLWSGAPALFLPKTFEKHRSFFTQYDWMHLSTNRKEMGYLFDIFLATKRAGIHFNIIMKWSPCSFFWPKHTKNSHFLHNTIGCICRQTAKKWDIFSTHFWPQKEQGFTSILLWSGAPALFFAQNIRKT